jgi:two-component system chemotaxis sensor kinase CheA
MDNPILREFLAETEDLLEILFGDLQALRVRRGEGRARRELVGRIFRHVHTLKGSSATVELETITKLAHEFETLLDGVRMGRVPVDDAVLDSLDAATGAISQSLKAVAHDETQPETQFLIERLRQLALQGSDERGAPPPPPPALQATLVALPNEITRSLSKHEAHRLRESLEEGAHLFVVNVNFDLATFDERFRDLSDALAEDGEIISTLPGTGSESPDQISFRIVYATKENREDLTARASRFGELSLTQLTPAKVPNSSKDDQGAGGEGSLESAQTTSISSLTTHLRVELSKLDEIIAGAHEVLVETTNALTLSQSFNLQPSERALMNERATAIRSHFVELEEQLIGLRMVTVAQMLERAARAGRIAARATGKDVDFETKGGEVKLDKALADTIADPLLHILRNAVDHGVESPSERKKIGKRVRGLVRLEARGEGNRVVLRVSDDGRGIDPLRITRAAAAQGIIEAGRLLTKQQALRLIFRPGFSTAISISNVSGRGVGLDVVERAVEQVGGELRVTSEQGAGTTFEVILPTTLALLPSLVVWSSGYRYCIDASHITETGFIAAADIERNVASGTIEWRGSSVLLMEMRKLLAQPPLDVKSFKESAPVIIVSHTGGGGEAEGNGIKRAAIIVDAVEGQTEALVRGLGRHAARWRGISGATELRDGTLALVLDLPRLLQ